MKTISKTLPAPRLVIDRHAAEARHARLVAHLDALAAQTRDPAGLLAIAGLRSVTARHFPWSCYDECNCDPGHRDEDEPGVIDVWEVGLVCDDGFLYSFCAECCTAGEGGDREQWEGCADSHDHATERPLCQTLAGIEGALGLSEPDPI